MAKYEFFEVWVYFLVFTINIQFLDYVILLENHGAVERILVNDVLMDVPWALFGVCNFDQEFVEFFVFFVARVHKNLPHIKAVLLQ